MDKKPNVCMPQSRNIYKNSYLLPTGGNVPNGKVALLPTGGNVPNKKVALLPTGGKTPNGKVTILPTGGSI
jgi:hypothetical protein